MNLKVMSYNFYCRPSFLGFKDNQTTRAKLLSGAIERYESLNGKIDVLMLQEIFDNKTNKIIKKYLKKIGFIFKSHRVKKLFKVNGGGLIYSRHPICKLDNYTFKSAQIFNAGAAKGVNYTKILKGDKYFHLMNVHLDSFSEKIRKEQMVKMTEFIKKINIPNDESIIIGGDYNIDMYNTEINNVDEVFDYEFVNLKKVNYTQYSISSDNDWILRRVTSKNDPDLKQQLIDFFIFNSEDILETEMEVVRFKEEQNANDIIYSSSFFVNIYNPFKTLKVEDLSDHYAICCDFKY